MDPDRSAVIPYGHDWWVLVLTRSAAVFVRSTAVPTQSTATVLDYNPFPCSQLSTRQFGARTCGLLKRVHIESLLSTFTFP